jgi:hypothetical protein
MTDPVTPIAAASAALVYLSKTAYEYVLKSKNGTSEEHKRCKAEEAQAATQGALNAQTELLKEIKESQQDTRDGVRELVTIQRTRY